MKICLAGTFGEYKDVNTVKKSPYLLESFYYIKDWQLDIIKNAKWFLLDSGAFTFMQHTSSDMNWEEYVDKYASFINKNKIDNFLELDIDKLIGFQDVVKLRKTLEDKTGRQCIPVWHKSRGYDEYLKMCEQYPYVAIGGIAIKDIKRSQYPVFTKLIKEAHIRGCRVHGLGFTNVTLLPKYHFDSVDSTRWNCARFGRLEYFDGETMKTIDKRREGKRLVGRAQGDTIKFTLNEWIKFQRYAETHL